MTTYPTRLECSSCAISVTARTPYLLGRTCLRCQRGKLLEPESIALRKEGGDPSVRINSPYSPSPWPHAQRHSKHP